MGDFMNNSYKYIFKGLVFFVSWVVVLFCIQMCQLMCQLINTGNFTWECTLKGLTIIFHLVICSSILFCSSMSTPCVWPSLHSKRQVTTPLQNRAQHKLPAWRTVSSNQNWSMRKIMKDDGWRLSDLLSRQGKDPWLPLHDKTIRAHLSFPL